MSSYSITQDHNPDELAQVFSFGCVSTWSAKNAGVDANPILFCRHSNNTNAGQ